MPSIPRSWGPDVTPIKREMIDSQQFGYRTHFEACGNINMWNDKQNGLYFTASLRGQAQTVLGGMRSENALVFIENFVMR